MSMVEVTELRRRCNARRAGLPTIFQDRANVAAGGLASYRLFQRDTSLEVRQRFIVGPDDE